ncbi:vomeronasal type-1 receptor 2-like [Pteronotus mesoamericanus]|uniref:vomeronasal type-1 receptor 2-like n=1 Tax=Pteronotus mesoamericanus TaxID=1884717 RepID=UPI0023EDB0FD|nr:vomeronasal type-1 receptor 2-like [Pteronotus parnellii mesoamericanus]
MASLDLKFAMIFLFQMLIGILGNFSLLHHYLSLYLSGYRSKSTDLILRHLTLTNSLVILSRGIPETLAAFGVTHFLQDFGCKLIFYVHRVARGVSMSTTSLLSIFQAITISPMNSRWAGLKARAAKYIGPSNILCWILNILLNIRVPEYTTDKLSNKTLSKTIDFGYCISELHDKDTDLLYILLTSTHDVLCLGLMTWASGTMVSILCRHKQRVQHIHGTKVSPRSSPEIRATQSILVLVTTFVSFYTFSSIVHIYFFIFCKTTSWVMNTSALINACFPTASPFVFLSSDQRVSRFFLVCTGRHKQFLHPFRAT